jgi:hypothetical protein
MATIQAERTPNPNSLKFTTTDGGRFSDDVEAISSADEADRHPLGERLFSIAGVDDVFITPEFVTVSKAPSTEWNDLKADVEFVLAQYVQNK